MFAYATPVTVLESWTTVLVFVALSVAALENLRSQVLAESDETITSTGRLLDDAQPTEQ